MGVKIDDAIVRVTAQCLCQKHTFTLDISRSSLPLEGAICHCNSCRHLTGAMYSSGVPWPGDKDAIQSSTLQKYPFSKRLTILFCGTCSSPMFWEVHERDEHTGDVTETRYSVFTGVVLHDAPHDWTRITEHIFVGDTLDGGVSAWLCNNSDNTTAAAPKRWHGTRLETEALPDDWPGAQDLPPARWTSDEPRDMPLRCHCGGVDLVYRRTLADAEFAARASSSPPGGQGLSLFVDPASRKPVVTTDACDSCRSSSGVEFVHWTFSSLRHLGFGASSASADGTELEHHQERPGPFPATLADLHAAVVSAPANDARRDPRLGTLAAYGSAEGARRYFCSRCSACVLCAADDGARRDDDVVRVAVGLFDVSSAAGPGEGARAEGAFLWLLGGEIKHREDVLGGGSWREGWLRAAEAASEAWRRRRNFPEWWRLGPGLEGQQQGLQESQVK